MTDRESFLSAIRANPADDTARLVFADWLQEQEHDRDRLHADYIRFQVDLARTSHDHSGGRGRRTGTGPQCPRCARERADRLNWHRAVQTALVPNILIDRCLFRRGFVDGVVCGWSEWEIGRDELLATHPVHKAAVVFDPAIRYDGLCGLSRLPKLFRGVHDLCLLHVPLGDWDIVHEAFRGYRTFDRLRMCEPLAHENELRRWFGTDQPAARLLNRTLTPFAGRRPR